VTPQRIQLRRTKGWRKPEGAIVARPSKWGNPFRAVKSACCPNWDVIDDNDVRYVIDHNRAHELPWLVTSRTEAQREAVRLFHADAFEWFGGRYSFGEGMDIAELAGHDLACWCPLEDAQGNRVPCHADVLLEIANRSAVTE
jgi:hypothetical protein